MSLTLRVVVNGASPAFMRTIGCPCVRCAEPPVGSEPTPEELADLLAWSRQAHTSVSLVIERDGVALDHTLVDCGMGVVNNLVGVPTPAQGQPVQRVLLTHGHFDHISGLDSLLFGLEGARRAGDFMMDEQPWPLPVYATGGTWRQSVVANPADPARAGIFARLARKMAHVDVTEAALDLATLELHEALTVTPIPVEHYGESVHYLFTFWPSGTQGAGAPIRVGICWDLLAYPAGRPGEVWHATRLDPRAGPLAELMAGVDLLFVELTSWRGGAPGHIGWRATSQQDAPTAAGYGVRDLLTAWRPGATRLIHYSGWDDRRLPGGTWVSGAALRQNEDPARGPVTDRVLRAAARADLPGVALDVAQPGETLICS